MFNHKEKRYSVENSNNPKDINEELQFSPYQNFEEKSNKKKKHDSKDEKKHKYDNPKHKKEHNDDDNDGKKLSDDYKMIESQIEDFFTKDGVDIAPYAYKLFNTPHEEGKDTDEMKNARSLFYKKLYHEENSEGYVYGFSSEELVHLQSLISSENNLSEQRIYDFFERIVEGYHKNSYLINENTNNEGMLNRIFNRGKNNTQQPNQQVERKKCPNCGALVPQDSVYCNQCQCNLTNDKRFCKHCGKPRKQGQKFCSYCGKQ